jgi:hypothetical protein
VTTAFISKSKELADIKADFPKTLTGAKSPATAREFMAAILSVCNHLKTTACNCITRN